MLKKPKNYEEARLILEKSATDDLTKNKLKLEKLQAIIVSGVAVAGLTALQLILGSPIVTAVHIPLAAILSLPNILPYFYTKKMVNELKTGDYFNNMTDETIKETAEKYVDEYNEFEKQQQEKKEGKML